MKISTKITFVLSFLIVTLFTPPTTASAQEIAIKNNLLYDATTTPNLGVEVGVGRKNTINLVYGFNAWNFTRNGMDSHVKHWVVMPELRWWMCSKMNGHFVGIHAMGGQFNAGNANLPIPGFWFGGENLQKKIQDNRCQGGFAGVGFTYGYQWILSKHWNLEAEIGVGYNHVWYDTFPCAECGNKVSDAQTNYVGVTKVGISFMYIF